MPAILRQYETLDEAAARLDCSIRTLRRLIASGHLKAYRLGQRSIRLDPADVEALLRPVPTVRDGAA